MHCLNSGGSRLQLVVVHGRTLVLPGESPHYSGRLHP
jgi:hypothetical protein